MRCCADALSVHRQYAEEHHINEELRKLLPRDEGKPIEKPAERALRERMYADTPLSFLLYACNSNHLCTDSMHDSPNLGEGSDPHKPRRRVRPFIMHCFHAQQIILSQILQQLTSDTGSVHSKLLWQWVRPSRSRQQRNLRSLWKHVNHQLSSVCSAADDLEDVNVRACSRDYFLTISSLLKMVLRH